MKNKKIKIRKLVYIFFVLVCSLKTYSQTLITFNQSNLIGVVKHNKETNYYVVELTNRTTNNIGFSTLSNIYYSPLDSTKILSISLFYNRVDKNYLLDLLDNRVFIDLLKINETKVWKFKNINVQNSDCPLHLVIEYINVKENQQLKDIEFHLFKKRVQRFEISIFSLFTSSISNLPNWRRVGRE